MSPLIDPSMVTTGPEWSMGIEGGLDGGTPIDGVETGGNSFGKALGNQVQKLTDMQTEAAEASRALATGEATDPTSTVVAVERAQLAMQLASQLRTKGVEAINDIFHTTV